MAVGIAAVPGGELSPGGGLGRDGIVDVGVLDVAIVEGEEALAGIGKAGGYGDVSDAKGNAGTG